MSDFIPVSLATKMNAKYRTNRELILKPEYQGQEILSICETFEKDLLLELISKPNCEKVRIYYGMDSSLKIHAVLCAVDGNDGDILPQQGADESLEDEEENYILETGQRCPVECPPASELNTGG
jgi:hypothetical protein